MPPAARVTENAVFSTALSGEGAIVNCGTTVIVKVALAVSAGVSVLTACTVNVYGPGVVGVPLIAPVEGFNESGGGNVPPGAIDQVKGVTPPVVEQEIVN